MSVVEDAAAERLQGGRPSPPRALLAALVAGFVVGVVVYRLLRR